ncbi:shikimate kinase [Williamsia serinedens]|uniref:Shikimate kinase n=1 Tax=Williamsia serinedens TaxID=391736 RepID=A0ABT1GW27_9NOCA|nr:shikimate kinase [Williamsia serinedens]MCP2159165.1 shikimate kinase [Williamsia serinedens]
MTGSATPEPAGRRPVAVLVGFMGAGKSTVGAALARLLDAPLVDTDAEIVRRAGRPIPQIFVDDGEQAFRDLEAQVVADVLATHTGVVALGGGAVTTAAVREALAGHAVVHLDITPEAGWARVRGSDRPLLRDDDGRGAEQRYRDLHAARRALYRSVTVHHVDATSGDADRLARRIVAVLDADHLEPTAGSPS